MTSPLRFLSLSMLILSACLHEPTPPAERPADLPTGPSASAVAETAALLPIELPAGVLGYGAIGDAALSLLERPLQLSEHAPEDDVLEGAITLFVTSNVRGEINMCGCRRNPRGGLARRASYLSRIRELSATHEEREPIVIDAGDALASVIASPPKRDDMAAVDRARMMLEVYGEIGVDVLLVNLRELRVGWERVRAFAHESQVPLLSSNLIEAEGGSLATEGHVILERDGTRLGFIGLTGTHRSNPAFLREQGLALKPPREALTAAGTAVREEGVDAVVLLSGLGVSETTQLLDAWAAEGEGLPGQPDFVVVSGSARMTRQPSWAGGVAMLEPGEGGREVMLISFIPDAEGRLQLTNHGGARFEAQGELLASLRRFVSKWRLSRDRAFDKNAASAWRSERAIAELGKHAKIIARRRGALSGGPATDVVPGFAVEIVELSKSMSGDPDIQERVDAVERESDVVMPKAPKIQRRNPR